MTLELLTASRLRAFRDCARKHQLAYVDGWRPTQTPDALRFGSLVHAGLELYWLALQTGGSGLSAIYEVIDRQAADPFEAVRASEMMAAYVARYFADDMRDYEVLGVEKEFRAPLLNPETWAASRTWELAGKIDAIVRRRSDQRVLIVESKTTSDAIESDADNYWSKLAIDGQISQYVIGAEALGHKVDMIEYDVLKKVALRPYLATPAESRKYKADGTLYANQRADDETPDEYRERVRVAIMEAPGKYLQRRSLPRAESQIQDWMFDAWQQSAVMRESARLNRAARNPEACHRFGAPCVYWALCSTGAKPEESPGEYMRVENKHPELGS